MINVNGIVQITGESGVGKTSFALQCGVPPERILFVDDDVKGQVQVRELQKSGIKFGGYWNLTDMSRGKTEYKFLQAVMKKIEEIKENQFDVLIWDTWTAFAASMFSYVVRHESEFRAEWSAMGAFKGPQRWQEARRLERETLGHLNRMIPQIFLISHLKQSYVGKALVPGQFEPNSSRVLVTVPVMRIWLRRNPTNSPVPIGLVLKGISKVRVDPKKGIRHENVLPMKLTPQPGDDSLWDSINRYWETPIGDREPEDHERPTANELAVINAVMTDDQKETFKQLIAADLSYLDDSEDDNIDSKIIKMLENKMSPPIIASKLDIDIQQVKEVAALSK